MSVPAENGDLFSGQVGLDCRVHDAGQCSIFSEVKGIHLKEIAVWKWASIGTTLLVLACGGGDDSQVATVSVFKSLNVLQCTGGGSAMADLQRQLVGAGVQVIAASCGTDGLAHVAACGVLSGDIGIFDVPAAQQAQAVALSFIPLGSAPSAKKTPCP
jgi:hypothetical protein